MLAILLSLFFSAGIQAQNFNSYPTNIEYGKNGGLNQYLVPDNAQFSLTDPTINLSMDCLAANGYGQWTVSSAIGSLGSVTATDHPWTFSPDQINGRTWDMTSVPKGWFLLGNLIGQPSEGIDNTLHTPTTTHPGCQPPGIVSGGKFIAIDPASFSTGNSTGHIARANGCIVTANLTGSVRYIQVEPTNRVVFLVEGLNDERAPTTPEQQIDISLAGVNPNPPQIVTEPIFPYTIISTGSNAVDNSDPSVDYRDEFHACIDQSFIYITWVFKNTHSKKEIWATIVDIFTGAVVVAPFQVAFDATNTHDYTRPTIACDVRNAPANPTYWISYITDLTTASVVSYVGGGVVAGPEIFNKHFYDPAATTRVSVPPPAKHYMNATHARVLVSSVAGSFIPPTIGVYVVNDDGLVLYWPTFPVMTIDYADYVDGNQSAPGTYVYPIAITSAIGGVVDGFITAFANPYDNQSGPYNQFHCLYQLNVNMPAHQPLILVRGSDAFCGYHTGGDTRVLLNQDNPTGTSPRILDDPSSYCGAVNQMGIHVHWRTSVGGIDPNTHFYLRDTRAFDEPIEENTLVTNVCTIADGTSHGVTSGASASGISTTKIAIWTDPDYGLNNSNPTSGLYFVSNYYSGSITGLNKLLNIGTLNFFPTTNISFNLVGINYGTSLSYTENASLATAPNCNINFNASGQSINIGTNCTWDFYGTALTNCFSNPLNGSIGLNGIIGEDSHTYFAFLNIHPGCQFFGFVPFFSNMGDVEIQYSANIYPLKTTISANPNQTGQFIDDKYTFLSNSNVNSHIPSSQSVVMKILGTGSGEDGSDGSLFTETTNFANRGGSGGIIGGGAGTIQFNENGNGGHSPDKVDFEGGTMTRINLHAIDPQNADFIVNDMIFDQLIGDPVYWTEILIERSGNFDHDYGNVIISNNTFLEPASTFGGIYLKNFNNSNDYSKLLIEYNSFDAAINGTWWGGIAIGFENCTGNIIHNHITDKDYWFGIYNISTGTGSLPMTHTYMCNNYISKVDRFGIVTDHFDGYVGSNQIDEIGDLGYASGVNDKPRILFTSIKNCQGSGVATEDATSDVDLSGVHGITSSGDDYAAYDTIEGNDVLGATTPATPQIFLTNQSHIEFGNRLQGSWTWTQFGENNILGITGNPLLINSDGTCNLGTADRGNIDRNYWGSGVDPLRGDATTTGSSTSAGSPGLWDIGRTNQYCLGVTYDLPLNTSPGWNSPPFGVSCSSGYFEKIKHSNRQPLAISNIDSCQMMHGWVSITPTNRNEYKMQYDTLRHYIESCAGDADSYDAFSTILSAAQEYAPDDTTRFDKLRDWLISVIYLNTTVPVYFCACMEDIASTYGYGKYALPNAALAVLEYLRKNPHCDSKGLEFTDSMTKISRHRDWLEGDTTKHEDTTLPTLEQIGLGFLLKNEVNPPPSTPLSSQYLASFTSSPNPFKGETMLGFTLNRMSYITLAIYDELGRLVWGDGRGSSLEAGTHTIQIDGSKLPSGTLYARIATGFGEVKTVKLVHEK